MANTFYLGAITTKIVLSGTGGVNLILQAAC